MTISYVLIHFVNFFDVLLGMHLYTIQCGKSPDISETSKENPKKDNESILNVEKHP